MSEVATLPDLGMPRFDNQASCAELTIETINDLFFDNNMHGQEAKDAKRICAACPAVEECEAYIIRVEHGVGYSSMRGIWAGMTPAERYRKYHKQKNGNNDERASLFMLWQSPHRTPGYACR